MIYGCVEDRHETGGQCKGGMREERMRHRCVAVAWILVSFWAALVEAPTTASAQTYPDRSVRIIIAFPAGGTIDTLGRIVAQKLSEAWGQSVFVENRPGASGNIGAAAAAQALPDGYTLHLGGQVLAVNVTLAPMKGLDPVRDFEPIMWIATAQDVMMVPPNSPFRSVKELVDYAKAHPGDLNYASLGIGSSGHLATTLFSDLAGIKVQHVPYTSYSQAVTDMISGRISLWITTLGGAIGNIQGGKMRALAVSGRARAAQLPDVPTFNELGIGFVDESSWYALFAPRGTPKDIIAKINGDMARILTLPDMREREATLGYRFIGGSPARLDAMFRHEIAKWAEVAKSASLR
jgi:tripartite-type tricarboxylate transporter receptor subunit TctC